MVLWTIIPTETVLDVGNMTPAYKEVAVNGRIVLVEMENSTRGRLVRIISTCPDDYLRPEWQPGRVLAWAPDYEYFT